MRLTTEKSRAETDSPITTSKILVNGKSYRVLVESIYRDRVRALIRELSCNAVDSHIEVDNKNPIDVHLPDQDNPKFYVEDYGLGMDEEDIEIFTTFFESTKEMSNKQIGCLGLGSKVFYGYNTRTATITATKNGVRRIYSFFMKDGIPSRTKLFEQEIDAPNGVKIEFVVAKNDVNDFYYKAARVFKWFEFPVNFVNVSPEKDMKEETPILEGDDYYFLETGNDAVVLMGNIPYHIEVSDKILEPYKDFINNSGLVIKAPIGAVDFDPSREGLGYTKKTLMFLYKRLEKIKQNIKQEYENTVNEEKTFYDAVIKYNELNISVSFFRIMDLEIDYTFNGETKTIDKKTYWSEKFELPSKERLMIRQFTPLSRGVSDKISSPNYSRSAVFVLNDLKTGYVGRIKQYVNQTRNRVFLLEPTKDDTYEILCQTLGINDERVVKTSELPAVPKVKKSTRQYVSDIMEFNAHVGYSAKTMWQKNTTIDPNKTKGIFVERKAFQAKVGGRFINYNNLRRLLSDLGLKKVYGIKPKDIKEFEKMGWRSLDSFVLKFVNNRQDEIVREEALKDTNYTRRALHREIRLLKPLTSLFPGIKDQLILLEERPKRHLPDISPYSDIGVLIKQDTKLQQSLKQKEEKFVKEIESAIKNVQSIIRKYSLLDCLKNSSHVNFNDVKLYIEKKQEELSTRN